LKNTGEDNRGGFVWGGGGVHVACPFKMRNEKKGKDPERALGEGKKGGGKRFPTPGERGKKM